jgi:hypothetical protein
MMDSLPWPESWVRFANWLCGSLFVLAIVAGLAFGSLFFGTVFAAGGVTCLFAARRLKATPALAVEGGDLLCHVHTSGGGDAGGGGSLKQRRFPLTDFVGIEEQLLPWGKERMRSSFVLKRSESAQGTINRMLGWNGVMLLPQLTDDEQRRQMRDFLNRHIKGEFTERVMDKPPWTTSR